MTMCFKICLNRTRINCAIKRGYRVIQKVANIYKITHPTFSSNFKLGDQKTNLPNFSPFFIKNVIKIRFPKD